MSEPLISICIPAYKKPDYVVRLLKSVMQQTYKRVEVVISDDSPDDTVKIAIEAYKSELSIFYIKNSPSLKSPANWNNAIKYAKGEYFILFHQDDWLYDSNALNKYLEAFRKNPKAGFVFCKNTAVTEDGKEFILQEIPDLLPRLTQSPLHLVLAQVIGPPSNTMLRTEVRRRVQYDEDFIWLVDVDYYVRVLQAGIEYVYLDEHLVNIGLHEDQTTVFCKNNSEIILKENMLFAFKIGEKEFKDIKLYDYYWRLLRNDNVRTLAQLENAGVMTEKILPIFSHMIHWQIKMPRLILRFGPASKILMFLNYITRS
ncbi:MAG: glycosyltransferase family 2 protein [Bacteroidota bacterium]